MVPGYTVQSDSRPFTFPRSSSCIFLLVFVGKNFMCSLGEHQCVNINCSILSYFEVITKCSSPLSHRIDNHFLKAISWILIATHRSKVETFENTFG